MRSERVLYERHLRSVWVIKGNAENNEVGYHEY